MILKGVRKSPTKPADTTAFDEYAQRLYGPAQTQVLKSQ
jgi:hypothetical protein